MKIRTSILYWQMPILVTVLLFLFVILPSGSDGALDQASSYSYRSYRTVRNPRRLSGRRFRRRPPPRSQRQVQFNTYNGGIPENELELFSSSFFPKSFNVPTSRPETASPVGGLNRDIFFGTPLHENNHYNTLQEHKNSHSPPPRRHPPPIFPHKKHNYGSREHHFPEDPPSKHMPMVLSFHVPRNRWNGKLEHKFHYLKKKLMHREPLYEADGDYDDNMEDYAKPSTSMYLGMKVWNWLQGNTKGDYSTGAESSDNAAKANPEDEDEKPRKKKMPPVAFMHGSMEDDTYPWNGHSYGNSKESDIPLMDDGHNEYGFDYVRKPDPGKFKPKCSKGGSMIFCNSDALTGLLELMEKHVQILARKMHVLRNHGNRDPGKSKIYYDEPEIVEMFARDPRDKYQVDGYDDEGGKIKGSDDFNPSHDVGGYNKEEDDGNQHYHISMNGAGHHHSPGQDEIEIVIVVNTKKGAKSKEAKWKPPAVYGGGWGSGYVGGGHAKNPDDQYRKPFKHFDDDEKEQKYNDKFERLKKIIDTVRERNNRLGVGGVGHNFLHGHGTKNVKDRGNKYREEFDAYWRPLIEEYKYGKDFSHYNKNKDRERGYTKKIGRERESLRGPNGETEGLIIDMRENREETSRSGGPEKYFGLAKVAKSKHASAEEREEAIKMKIRQIYENLSEK